MKPRQTMQQCQQAPARIGMAFETRRETKREYVVTRDPAPSATNTQRPVAYSVMRSGTGSADTR